MLNLLGLRFKLQQWKSKFYDEYLPYFEKLFVSNIPSENIRDLPGFYVLVLGSLVYACILATFLYTLLSSYISSREEKFLSLSRSAGECTEVYRPLTGTYLVDSNGYWEGMTHFHYPSALYSFHIYTFEGSQEDFYDMVYLGYEEVLELAEYAAKQNLALNLLHWMVYSLFHTVDDFSQTWRLTGKPSVIFDRAHLRASLATIGGVCDVVPVTNFDKSTATLYAKYDFDLYNASTACRDAVIPMHMGYFPAFDAGIFTVQLDLKALTAAMVVNMGFMSYVYLDKVPDSISWHTYNSTTYEMALYYNSNMEGMRPITCLVNDPYVSCVLEVGGLYVYPIFDHMGSSISEPQYCECGSSRGHTAECNYFNLFAGFLFFEYDDATESQQNSLDRLVEFTLSVNTTTNSEKGEFLNRAAYNASYDAVLEHTHRNDLDWRSRAYEFCALSDGSHCSLFSTLFYDTTSYSVSEHAYQVRYGSCNDSFSLRYDAIERLASTTPEPLLMPYFECKQSKFDALLAASGIANGNVSLIVPVITTLFVMLFGLYLKIRERPEPQTYSSEEKRDLLEFLAVNILSIRDNNNAQSSTPFSAEKQPLLYGIKDELSGEPEYLAKHFYAETIDANQLPPRVLTTCNIVENPLYTQRRAVSRADTVVDIEMRKLYKC